jgi:hypothetical protein
MSTNGQAERMRASFGRAQTFYEEEHPNRNIDGQRRRTSRTGSGPK